VSCFIIDGSILMVTRFLSGLAAGTSSAIALSAFASIKQPSRGYGVFNFLLFGLTAVSFVILPMTLPNFGIVTVFSITAGCGVVSLVVFRFAVVLDLHRADKDENTLKILLNYKVAIALSMFLVFMIGGGSFWTYVERMGITSGLDIVLVGRVLALGILIGSLGALIPILLGRWVTHYLAFASGLIVFSTGVFYLTIPHVSAIDFFITNILTGISVSFLIAVFQTLFAKLDTLGRVVAIGVFVMLIGRTLGSLSASLVVSESSYVGAVWLSLGLAIVALLGMSAMLLNLGSAVPVGGEQKN